MNFRPREWITHFHLIVLAGLVSVALVLVVIGGSVPAWCIRHGDTFECHSLLQSERGFSCLFKLLPTSIIVCIILSLFMFVTLIIGQVRIEYSGIAKRQYQFVARLVNILALSTAIVLIMFVLLQWFHPPSHTAKNDLLAMIPLNDSSKNANNEQKLKMIPIPADHKAYLEAVGAKIQPIKDYRLSKNHGPNLFFAAFIILFIALLSFVGAHRL